MGQRHQVYVISKSNKEYTAIGAFHHQWCYGLTATTDLIRLVEAASKALQGEFSRLRDPREIDVLVKSIYGIDFNGQVTMVHNEAEYLIKNGVASPENGDNNDGAALLIIDNDKKECRGCLFTPGHVEGEFSAKCKPWRAYAPNEYLSFYYNVKTLAPMLDGNLEQAEVLSRQGVKPVLQAEFNKIFSASIKAKVAV